MHRPQLAKTLKIISGEDMDSLSASTLLKNVVADLEDIGGFHCVCWSWQCSQKGNENPHNSESLGFASICLG